MTLCYPPSTDWSCQFTVSELETMREDPAKEKLLDRSEALAWYTLASLTAYRIGVCPITVRPCAARCAPTGSWMASPAGGGGSGSSALPLMTIGQSFTPHIHGGNWVNSCGCGSGFDCSCQQLSEVILPGPVGHIVEVKQGGVIIDPSDYRVDNGDRLVALNGRVWPSCQNMAEGPDGEGAFAVTYYRGAAPNELTNYAAGVLANEFYKACSGGKCRLPAGVRQVARGGVTYQIETGMFEDGYTGIREVDAVIRIFNPHALKAAPTVVSPGSRQRARRTTWGNY